MNNCMKKSFNITGFVTLFLVLVLGGASRLEAKTTTGIEAGTVFTSTRGSGHPAAVGFTMGVFGEQSWHGLFVEAAPRLTVQPVFQATTFKGNFFPSQYSDLNDVPMYEYRSMSRYTPIYLNIPVRVGFKVPMPWKARLTFSAGMIGGLGLLGNGYARTYLHTGMGDGMLISNVRTGNVYPSSRWIVGGTARIGLNLPCRVRVGLEFNTTNAIYPLIGELSSKTLIFGYEF